MDSCCVAQTGLTLMAFCLGLPPEFSDYKTHHHAWLLRCLSAANHFYWTGNTELSRFSCINKLPSFVITVLSLKMQKCPPGTVAKTCSPSMWEAKAERRLKLMLSWGAQQDPVSNKMKKKSLIAFPEYFSVLTGILPYMTFFKYNYLDRILLFEKSRLSNVYKTECWAVFTVISFK